MTKTAAEDDSAQKAALGYTWLQVDPELLTAIITGTRAGLKMADINPVPVGASRLTQARHSITVMVGLVGRHSGNISLNVSETAMLYLGSRLMDEELTQIDEQSTDALMEVGNMIGGAIKGPLRNTGYAISHISLPSLILGQSYSMVYSRGITTASVEFEIPGLPFCAMNDRFFSTTISLLQGAGARRVS